MDHFVIQGPTTLEGTIRVNGSKNASLPILAASLLTDEPLTLHDIPDLADINNMLRLLDELGCQTHISGSTGQDTGRTIAIQAVDHSPTHARYDIVRTMRASICTLGPMLARRGKARISMPGGCAIGDRPVDLHLRGLEALGARITLDSGDIVATCPPGDRLIGNTIFLGGPFGSTVLGTANVMSAATLAKGTTVIESAACEPEIVDLANLLNAMGAQITGAGSPRITITGVDELFGTNYTVMPDRIEAGTFMCAAAITQSQLTIDNCPLDSLLAVIDRLEAAGVIVTRQAENPMLDHPAHTTCIVDGSGPLRPIEITTQPHPGFPTDLQAQFMAMLSLAHGNSVITERIFPERFLHVAELGRMGAHITRAGSTAVVSGVPRLTGAPVMASDLRASASLVLAGLAAKGTTIINRVYHLDRGYERLETRLQSLGARIERVANHSGIVESI